MIAFQLGIYPGHVSFFLRMALIPGPPFRQKRYCLSRFTVVCAIFNPRLNTVSLDRYL